MLKLSKFKILINLKNVNPWLQFKIVVRNFFPNPQNALLRELRKKRRQEMPFLLELPDGKKVDGLKPLEAYNEYKDLFIEGIYAFHANKKAPIIIDGGAYVGFSVVYFKTAYPDSRVIAYECDPHIFKKLEENIRANQLKDVQLIQAALASKNEDREFFSSGSDAGSLQFDAQGSAKQKVRCQTLSSQIQGPVDLIKLNIEGAELEVLKECEHKLHLVREMIIEFHSFAGQPQVLDEILAILKKVGFRYLINHFDYESNLAVKPPFDLPEDTSYILLIYASRIHEEKPVYEIPK